MSEQWDSQWHISNFIFRLNTLNLNLKWNEKENRILISEVNDIEWMERCPLTWLVIKRSNAFRWIQNKVHRSLSVYYVPRLETQTHGFLTRECKLVDSHEMKTRFQNCTIRNKKKKEKKMNINKAINNDDLISSLWIMHTLLLFRYLFSHRLTNEFHYFIWKRMK